MKKLITILILILSLNSVSAAPIDDYINQQAAQFMRINHVIGLAVEVYDHGQAHSYYYGYANRETQQKVTANTIFDIGSVTKIFTSLLLALEVNQGRMQLTAPVTKYLPIFAQPTAAIYRVTLLNLATHTAGFAFYTPRNIKSNRLLCQYLATWQPTGGIGTEWRYSNFGMGLLGAAIEYIEPGNYDKPYQDQILLPLKMSPIAYDLLQAYKINHAQGYDGTGKIRPNSELDIMLGSWAMNASGQDMLHFLSAAIGLPGTPVNIVNAMHMTQTPYFATAQEQIGLGWEIYPLTIESKQKLLQPRGSMPIGPIPVIALSTAEQHYNANDVFDKTGSWDGFRSYIIVLPAAQSGVVIMVNSAVNNGNMRLFGRKILFHVAN